ncbi:uncharacterized protein QYS62_011499 [Fusarium acuminatum]|uniref:Uncharacterized protein n=1 Tax=Fusarium acuminatum TaxID=5515 RepID=A0ABZ2XBU6_9HYPO
MLRCSAAPLQEPSVSQRIDLTAKRTSPQIMDGLRALARTKAISHGSFQESQIGARYFSMIRVFAYPTQDPTYERGDVPEEGVSEPLGHPQEAAQYANARLNLVIIPRDDTETIKMSRNNFLRLYDSFNIDPSTLDHICQNWYGFDFSGTMYNGACTFFIGTVLYTLAFSFNPATTETSAILLPRDSNGFSTGLEATREFETILRSYIDKLRSPTTLILVALVHLEQWLDMSIYRQLRDIRRAEHKSGYGPYGMRSKRVEIDTLTRLSIEIGTTLVTLSNTVRHQEIAKSLVEFLDESAKPDAKNSFAPARIKEVCDASFLPAIDHLKRQLKGGALSTKYLQERTQSQSDVIFALLTHEDAKISIDQGESMKTIAVVTMVFLPGTFLATLWAVPSLQWDQTPVIKSNFWVYWVFALPFTAFVLVIWHIFTRQKRYLTLCSSFL